MMNKRIENALETIHFALMGYCEDCISSEPSEKKRIDRAYQTILKALEEKQRSKNVKEN
jgi:hypothetical protein